MKMKNLLLVLGMAVMMMGCGAKEEPAATEEAVSTQVESLQETEEAVAETEEAVTETVMETQEAGTEENAEGAAEDDNFSVDPEDAKAFALQVKEAVAAKDLEALADLTAFPMYVGLEEGKTVESKEDFLALGADAIFTEELVNAIANADENELPPSMAGFVLMDGNDGPNISFQLRDGKLSIGGINY